MRNYFIIFFLFLCQIISAQIPDSLRFDWNNSGNEVINIPQKTIYSKSIWASYDSTANYTYLLQALINSHQGDTQLVIHFDKGTYKFMGTVFLKSNITIEGEGALKTKFKFDNSGNGNLFEINSPQYHPFIAIPNQLYIHSNWLDTTGINQTGFYELLVDGAGLATSDWALNSIGQIFKINELRGDSALLSTELKLNFYKYSNPRIRLLNLISHVHFKYFSLERLDKTTGQSNNFNFFYSFNCSIVGVESFKSNMSHVTFAKSYRGRVADSYFHHAFDYGGGGKAYGVELSFSSGNCLIENNIFDNLRHSILIQSGANGNVISGNFSVNPFWKEGLFPSNSAGELVLHGNYPFANLFEGNEVGNIVIDNSHGFNGPGNVFYKNRASVWGVFMNDGAGNSHHFIGNEILGTFNNLTGLGNFTLSNLDKNTDLGNFTIAQMPSSLYLTGKPIWWPTQKSYPIIDLSKASKIRNIPSKNRSFNDTLKALNTQSDVFLFDFTYNFQIEKNQLMVHFESDLQVNVSSLLIEKLNVKHGLWQPVTKNFANNFLFEKDIITESIFLLNENTCYRWKARGLEGQSWASDTFCLKNPSASNKEEWVETLKIFPNPAKNFTTIYLPKPSDVRIYNLMGQEISYKNYLSGDSKLDLSNFSTGSYIVDVFDGEYHFRQHLQIF